VQRTPKNHLQIRRKITDCGLPALSRQRRDRGDVFPDGKGGLVTIAQDFFDDLSEEEIAALDAGEAVVFCRRIMDRTGVSLPRAMAVYGELIRQLGLVKK
jgi:hypothetical protein